MSKVKEAVTVHWGDRCPDHDPECPTCQAWDEYDTTLQMNVEILLQGFLWALCECDIDPSSVDTWSERWGYDINICGYDYTSSAPEGGLVAIVYPLKRDEYGGLAEPVMVVTTQDR